jgi:hypothetical protein
MEPRQCVRRNDDSLEICCPAIHFELFSLQFSTPIRLNWRLTKRGKAARDII